MSAALVVYLFLSPSCPMSERYRPDVERLRADFPAVRFEEPPGPIHGARVTPSVVVTQGGRVRYRGRIDDRSPSLGIYRAPVRQDLREALEALLAGKPVPTPETAAVGCAISVSSPKQDAAITFAKHVAPILFQHCAPCHRDLTSHQASASRAAAIAEVTRRRIMPPWKPDPGPPHFIGARRLTDAQIRLIGQWAADGAPLGSPADLPPVPQFRDGWQLPDPDMVVRMPTPFEVPAGGDDIYTCVVVPLKLSATRYVRAFEFRPGNARVMHHALLFLDASGVARRRGTSYPCFGVPGFLPTASLGGWTPGFTASEYPPRTAVTLRPGMDLVLQLHYHPVGRAESDQSELALYFTDSPPTRRMMAVALGSRIIDIAPGVRRHVVRDHFTLPVPVEVTGIIPHAHYICREMRGVAILPGGKRVTLITIRDWDFNWQQHFRYAQPFTLPADTRLEMEFVYDNSDTNPRNPARPARRVQWGPDSTDEMAGLHVQVVPANDEDARELGQSLWGKIMRDLGGGILRR